MTDKVQKIREEVEKLMYGFNLEADIASCEDAKTEKLANIKYQLCKKILEYIDTMQEETASEDLGDYINELSKQFPEVSFAKLSRIAVSVSRWQRNQDTKNKLPKVISRTDLDEFAYQCAYDMSNDWAIENPTWHDVEDACKLGANWQKQQDQSTIELAEDHAMLAGM